MAPFSERDTKVYRRDVAAGGSHLTVAEREKLLRPYLPELDPPSSQNGVHKSTGRSRRRRRVRPFLKQKLHAFLFFLIQLVFGVYIRLRQIYHATTDRILAIRHHHHRTPEYIRRDVANLSRLPEHLSVILKYKSDEEGGLEALMDEVAELCAWSASAGIPLLSVYEKSGTLKTYMGPLQELVLQKLRSYFGSGAACPTLSVYSPNLPSQPASPLPSPRMPAQSNGPDGLVQRPHLNLLLLSYSDGRPTLVDLTRTLAEMSQSGKISPADITSNLVNTEISATTSIPASPRNALSSGRPQTKREVDAGEPDLVLVFSPLVKLDGYPPWQIRLSEIFCVGDSGGDISGGTEGRTRVEYQGFLRGLWRFAGAEMRFGR